MNPASAVAPRIQFLGSALLHLPGQPGSVLAAKDAVLLAHLALQGAGARDALAALLWQDREPAVQRANLRQRIKRLQDASGGQLLALLSDKLALGSTVLHDLATLAQDLLASPQAAPGALLGGLQLSSSPAAAQWLDGARQRVHAQRLLALQAQADALEHSGQFEAARAYTTRVLAEEPLQEHSHRQLMRLHYLHGEKAAALAAYQRLCKLLHKALQQEPDKQTQALARLVESAQPAVPASTGNDAVEHCQPAVNPAVWAALLRPPQLLQRETEWHQLSKTWAEGGICIVLGEAGMGKTRLLNDFADSVALTLRLQAKLGDHAVPYALLSRWVAAQLPAAQALPEWARSELARLVPELGPASPGKLIALRLVKALTMLPPPGGAVLLDDLHHADKASLELLPAVLQTVRCALLGARADEMPPVLGAWLDWPSSHTTVVHLKAWTPASISSLLALVFDPHHPGCEAHQQSELALQLWHNTAGHPFFVLELLRMQLRTQQTQFGPATAASGNPSLDTLIQKRLLGLTPAALQLARLAALAGPEFTVPLAAAAAGVHEIELLLPWHELQKAQLLGTQGLTSDLVAHALTKSVPSPIASELHGRIAGFLVSTNANPARAAQHWLLAGRYAESSAQWGLAAELAHRAGRPSEELAQLDQGVASAQQAGDAEQAFALGLRAVAASHALGPAADTRRRLNALLASPVDSRLTLDAELAHCKHLIEQNLNDEALAVTDRTFAAAQERGTLNQRLRAAAWRGLALALDGAANASYRVFDDHNGLVQACDRKEVAADYFGAQGHGWFVMGRYAHALPALEQAARLANDQGDFHEAMVQWTNVAVCASQLGNRQHSAEASQTAMALWRHLGEPQGLDAAMCQMHAGAHFTARGHFHSALQMLNLALQAFKANQLHDFASKTEFRLVRLYLCLGRVDLAQRTLTKPGPQVAAGTKLMHLTLLCKLQPDSQSARVMALKATLAAAPPAVQRVDRLVAELVLATKLPPEEAGELLQGVLRHSTDHQEPLVQVHARARLADTLRKLGRLADAAQEAQEALLAFETAPPAEMHCLEFWWLTWQALQAGGRQQHAEQVLSVANSWIEQALTHVPAEFRHSFLEQNPFVFGLRQAVVARKNQAAHLQY